jgi:mannosylglycerate hydrolase
VRYWVVPHTHWDREWYLPFEHFRIHLARTVDAVLETLERDPAFRRFTLDGQAVVLEDYLEVRPQNEGRLRRLVAGGRLAIGPWYTLADEYLAGQESLVRNLLLGRQVCERFGRPMRVGYAPDAFGHVAQLPQILRGFGLDNLVFWRGLGDEAARLGAAFRWQGPDGSQVLAVRQLGGYGNADRLGDGDPQAAAERVAQLTERFGASYAQVGLDDMLLCNGNDHCPIQRDLPGVLDECERRLPGTSFRIATIEEYVERVRGRARRLETVAGELCGGREIAVLRGVNSSRMYLKQANELAERELFTAEALASLALARGFPYPREELRHAWRELLLNHAHDSVCGCSIDAVHRDMERRFETATEVARLVQRFSLRALAGESEPWWPHEPPRQAVSLANVLPWTRRRAVTLPLPPELARARAIAAEVDGEPVPAQRDGRSLTLVADVEGLGAAQARLRRGTSGVTAGARVVSARGIENEHYQVEVAADGTLIVTDRASGLRVSGLHRFEDVADRGDEYNFCALEGDRPRASARSPARIRILRRGPAVAELGVELTLLLPSALVPDRHRRTRTLVACPVRTAVSLVAGTDRIELRTTITNRARDHRLRVLFPAPDAGETVRVEGHFGVLRRPLQPVWNGRWSEPPQTTHHTLGMVACGRLALFTRGLPEYEALRQESGATIALTLLRCVGWLSRGDLANRSHHAGPALETPEAQCLGTRTFEYALGLRGDAPDAQLVRAAHDYRFDLAVGPPGAVFPDVRLEGDGFALAALKAAEDDRGLIARVYNPGTEQARLQVSPAARRCRIDETAAGGRPVRTTRLRPFEIRTLAIEP